MSKVAALIRQQFKVNPFELSDDDFAQLGAEALFLVKNEQKMMQGAVLSALAIAFEKTD